MFTATLTTVSAATSEALAPFLVGTTSSASSTAVVNAKRGAAATAAASRSVVSADSGDLANGRYKR